uniref:ISXO2-like transposase domain-containing protein n=1 Tax=Chromera velia CCMP2878 TaxID=1169474 RepID=A0A0G4G7R8_9ALVE|eukprot:Cvel_20569.t1-p1 / transcript=Cvel_20569.t1 / gene=Cvel_20569 / organism=Chromera_velia_CCMP2878 / gene_product=hypothetical protein / transcript_product=hypothetical protein / location=Cvel_scaffold1858:668-3740(-) / protein_length=390 / sequence_SO=supercontig / SO=protein_coding / is_pseudo=false
MLLGTGTERLACPSCKRGLRKGSKNHIVTHRCRNTDCHRDLKSFSERAGGFLQKTGGRVHLGLGMIIKLVYYVLVGVAFGTMINMTKHSQHTVSDYTHYIEAVMAEDILRNGWGRRFGGNLIGGEDEEVEMDETKMGACKDGKGHPVEGVWVLVAVCRRTGRFVAEPVRCRCKKTIKWFLDRHVDKRSTLYTDGWAAYQAKGVGPSFKCHRWVNHKKEFVADDGTNTNTVEGLNFGLKQWTRRRNWRFESIIVPLLACAWRTAYSGQFWTEFWRAASEVRFPGHPYETDGHSRTVIANYMDLLNRPPPCNCAEKKARRRAKREAAKARAIRREARRAALPKKAPAGMSDSESESDDPFERQAESALLDYLYREERFERAAKMARIDHSDK